MMDVDASVPRSGVDEEGFDIAQMQEALNASHQTSRRLGHYDDRLGQSSSSSTQGQL